jgi:hypothetical protein
MRNIEIQLGDRNRIDLDTGRRLAVVRYWIWRQSAQFALHHKQDEFSFLKAWLKKQVIVDIEKTLVDALVRMRAGTFTSGDLVYCLEVSPYLRKVYKPKQW